jgi:DNA-binding LytR/AlgR family response regulator
MIQAVILEDERLSADRLKALIEKHTPEVDIIQILDSVSAAREWLQTKPKFDLIFLDIQLNDGTSFDLLMDGLIHCPIIFTTAYDQFAIKAFKYNSVDYLLKPVNVDELKVAVEKYQKITEKTPDISQLTRLVKGDFKKRFLVKLGERLQSVEVTEIAYFFYDSGVTFLTTKTGKKWPVDTTIESLEDALNPLEFFRINRKLIVSLQGISEIHTYFNGRLLLKLDPAPTFETIVSRERVSEFKLWMDL